MKKKLLLSIFCVSLLLTGCGKVAELKNGEQVVAEMDGKKFSANDLYEELKDRGGSTVLVNMIDEYIANKEMETTDEMRQNAETTYKQYEAQYEGFAQDFEEILKNSGYSGKDEFMEELILTEKREAVAEKFVQEELTEEEINKYYEENIFGDMTARHILITPDVNDDMSDEEKDKKEHEALEKAKDLIKQLENGANFESLAKEHSDDEGSKKDGGLIKDFSKDSVVESFWNASLKLKDGEYTKEPVESDYGYHIILKVSQKKKPSKKEALADIKENLAEEKMNDDKNLVEKTWVNIRKKYKLNIQDDKLNKGYNKIVDSVDSK